MLPSICWTPSTCTQWVAHGAVFCLSVTPGLEFYRTLQRLRLTMNELAWRVRSSSFEQAVRASPVRAPRTAALLMHLTSSDDKVAAGMCRQVDMPKLTAARDGCEPGGAVAARHGVCEVHLSRPSMLTFCRQPLVSSTNYPVLSRLRRARLSVAERYRRPSALFPVFLTPSISIDLLHMACSPLFVLHRLTIHVRLVGLLALPPLCPPVPVRP